MITCPKCNKELADGTRFCDECGAEIFETIFCPNCGSQTSSEFAFCQTCGASVTETPVEEQPEEAPKKEFPKKAILFGGIGVAVVAVITLIICLLVGGGKKEHNFALYLKDGDMFFNELGKKSDSWQITNKLLDDDFDDDELKYVAEEIGYYCTYITDDGKYIFYPDKISGEDEGFNLYFRELGDPDGEAVKIDSDVKYGYYVNDSATIVTYIKGGEGNLYQYNIKKDTKEKIDSEVTGFVASEDGKKIIYLNEEDSVYVKNGEDDAEKIASEITSLWYISKDLTTIYYTKDETLYKQVEGEDREKIASDVYGVMEVYETGEVYYRTQEDAEPKSLMDYVYDDMKDADASITKPTYPTYPPSPKYPSRPYSYYYDTTEEYQQALDEYYDAIDQYEIEYDEWLAEKDRMDEEYDAAYDAYWEKLDRDDLREELAEETLERTSYKVYFYDGEESTVLIEDFDYNLNYTFAEDAPVIFYEAYSQSDVEKVKLSEIEYAFEVESMVKEAMYSSTETYIAVKGNITLIEDEEEATSFTINDAGTIVYYIDEIPKDEDHGELYRIEIDGDDVGDPELYDSDVYMYSCSFINDEQFKYFKDVKESHGDLYIDKEEIAYDVYTNKMFVDEDANVYFLSDYDKEERYGTLNVYTDGKDTKIADEVYDYNVLPDGRVLFLTDYSDKYFKGELKEWDDGETRKIDDDVSALIDFRTSEEMYDR